MFRSNGGAEEAVSGTGIYEGMDWSSWNKVRGNRDCERVQVVKSGCIESGALVSLTQSSVSVEIRGLLTDFLTLSQTWLWKSYL